MKKTAIRIITLILAILLVLGMCSGLFAMIASAADSATDATLSNLTISGTAFKSSFNRNTVTYETGDVAHSVMSITITPTVDSLSGTNPKIEIGKRGEAKKTVNSGNTETVSLSEGTNYIEIDVSASDKAATTYTIKVYRAELPPDVYPFKIITADTTVSQTLTIGKVSSGITVTFNFLPSDDTDMEGEYTFDELSMPIDSSFGWTNKTKLKITSAVKDGNIEYFHAVLSNVTYTGSSRTNLELYIYDKYYFSVPISSKYFKESASTDDEAPKPNLLLQSVTVRNADGQKLEKVDKDTPPFTVEVVFYDVGLINLSKSEVQSAKIHSYITSAAGFKTLSGTGGTIEVLTSAAEYPRFRATFKNIQSDGVAKAMGIKILYELPDYENVAIGELSFELFQVTPPPEEDKEKETSLRPNLIIQEYSYGDEAIVAGSEFHLDMKIANTSKNTGVENVVMTITPGSGFVIAAASNTVYFSNIAAGETVPHSIALRAAAAGSSAGAGAEFKTDYSVQIDFSYQYLLSGKYEPPVASTPVKIAIPVVQLDRFNVNEITEYTSYLAVGEEGYLSVPIINKGNSTTFNIEGSVKAADEASFTAPVVNFGNLEAGKSGTVDLSIIVNVPGEFKGEAVMTYEDENRNQKQVTTPFSIMVEQRVAPPPDMPPEDPGQVKPEGPGLFSILFCVLGALLISAPIALYLVKFVKARGNEDIDEGF